MREESRAIVNETEGRSRKASRSLFSPGNSDKKYRAETDRKLFPQSTSIVYQCLRAYISTLGLSFSFVQ